MLSHIKSHLAAYKVKPITPQLFPQVYTVYASNQDFFTLTQGKHTTLEKSTHDITALPPGCTQAQKIYIGLWQAEKPVAVVDIIQGFPDAYCFWIGLLLIHGQYQGQKIGSQIVDAILCAARMAGYKTAQLGVVDGNIKGIAFWAKHGFLVARQKDGIVVMTRPILEEHRTESTENTESTPKSLPCCL